MPELRTDWLTGRSVFIAENRALRPNEFANHLPPTGDIPSSAGIQDVTNLRLAEAGLPDVAGLRSCPFCLGNEHRTPPAVYEKLDDNGRWRVRVVPNAYPAVINLSGNESPAPYELALATADSPPRDSQCVSPAIGAHEVIIESPGHVDGMAALSVSELRYVVEAYAERLQHWRNDGRLRFGLVFKNQGPRAGASLTHVHSQLVGLPLIPRVVDAEISRATQAYEQNGRCAYCDLVDHERLVGTRVVSDVDGYFAFCPFASWQPHEVWLMPAGHEPSFELAPLVALHRLARVLHHLIAGLEAVAPCAHYNLLLRTAPWHGDYDRVCHWRIELLPRANSLAGLEVATGIHINPMPPERAAQELRTG